jgi:hypothetical protein
VGGLTPWFILLDNCSVATRIYLWSSARQCVETYEVGCVHIAAPFVLRTNGGWPHALELIIMSVAFCLVIILRSPLLSDVLTFERYC